VWDYPSSTVFEGVLLFAGKGAPIFLGEAEAASFVGTREWVA
jgi:hypothetical protein